MGLLFFIASSCTYVNTMHGLLDPVAVIEACVVTPFVSKVFQTIPAVSDASIWVVMDCPGILALGPG